MKPLRPGRAALVLVAALVACATQDQARTGITSQQAPGVCLRGGVPCATNDDCCSRRCENATCRADPLASPESIRSRSLDDVPGDPTSGLGTPGGHEGVGPR